MADSSIVTEGPEFHIVVKRPGQRSPLAPYRFVITLGFALAVCGMPLWNAIETGYGVDDTLLRLAGAALFAWLVLGLIDNILSSPSSQQSRTIEPPVPPAS